MKTIVHWIDPLPNLASGIQPSMNLSRKISDEHWIPQTSVIGSPVLWTVCRSGDVLRVPVFAYRSASRYAPSVFVAGLEIGLATLADLRKHTSGNPLIVHLVLGNQCTDLSPYGEDAYRCYVGIAIQTKE